MTEEQLDALKYFIAAKIQHAMASTFDNEMMLGRAAVKLDEAMLTIAPRVHGESHD